MSHKTLRDQIRVTVAAIAPLDPAEAQAQASVLAWIDSGAPLFRDHGPMPPRHLAVYFAILDDARRTVLQVDHIKAQAWVLPGGHVDSEPPTQAVVREAAEELTVQAGFHPTFDTRPLFITESVTRGPGQHTDVTLWFVLRGSQDMPLGGDETEFRGLRWVSIDRPGDWIATCHAPTEVGRFLTKLSRSLPAPAAV